MKKNYLRSYITLGIIFVVFTVISFAVPFRRNGLFWFAYLSVLIALVLQILVFKVTFGKGEGARSKFYGFPIIRVGVIYFAVQLVLGFIEMALSTAVPAWIFVVINVVVLAAALMGCIAADAIRDEVERQDIKIKVEVERMRTLQSRAEALVNQCRDNNDRERLKKASDEFKYSDPVTCDASVSLEEEMAEIMNEMQKAVTEKDSGSIHVLCDKILNVLAERNRICRLNK